MDRTLTTIASVDVVAYSRHMERDEIGTLQRLRTIRSTIIDPAVDRHGGRTVKLIGDGALLAFTSVVEAVQCAVEIQCGVAARNAPRAAPERLLLRIGLHLGDVVVDGDDLYGDGVNVAARLEGIAGPGEIVVSQQVLDQLGSNAPASFVPLGDQRLKNISRPIRAYRASLPGEGGLPQAPGIADTARENWPPIAQRTAGCPAVAVIPFANLGADPAEDCLADGITEDLTTALARHRWLTVVARNPAFAFRGSTESPSAIGQKLHADYLVTGSMRRAGSRFRITTQLVDAATGASLWSERFDRDTVDIFELQDEIAQLLACRIEAELGLREQRRAQAPQRKNCGAWEIYQRGLAEFYAFTPDSNRRAQALLRQAIARDPAFAGAHARLAYAVVLGMVYFDAAVDGAALDAALDAARRAIALDDQDANGFFTLGRVHLARREYDLAINALERALELNPNLAVSYCGLGDSLTYEGRLDEAIEQFDKAIRLSPHDPFRWAFYAYRSLAHILSGQYQEAATWARRAVQTPNTHFWAAAHLVAALGHLGDEAGAGQALRQLKALQPKFSVAFARERLFYLRRPEQLERYLEGLRKAGVDGA